MKHTGPLTVAAASMALGVGVLAGLEVTAAQWWLFAAACAVWLGGPALSVRIKYTYSSESAEPEAEKATAEIAAWDPLRESFKPLEQREAERQRLAAARIAEMLEQAKRAERPPV
jgi:hypothetical protein